MANSYIQTLSTTISAMISDEPISDVPCDTCTICCQLLSPFLTPEEIASGRYPISLINGPEGPVVALFRNTYGGCAMLKDNKCSIYEDRPIACRQFDCRKGHHPKTNVVAKEKFGTVL
jgi:Fe-S-cluster containining protein